ncbi:ABC transporter ATP-binding and permease protein [Bacillus sp. TS-2]|nr:ABC transporter ATP-binding and permease protein [Bacillus sp. TS-2]
MRSILKYLTQYRWFIVLVLILTLLGSLLELLLPTLMAQVVDIGIVNEDVPYMLQMGGWMLVCSILAILLSITSSFFATRVALGFGKDIRKSLFVHVEKLSVEEYERIGAASLITRTTNDVKQVQDVMNMMLRMMTRAPLMLIGGIILAVSRDAGLSLIFLGALPVLALTIFFISKKAIPLFSVLQQKTDRLNLILRENLNGIRVIRAFNREETEQKRFNTANEEFRDTGIRVNQIMSFLFPLMMLIMNFTNVAIVWFGAIRIEQGLMEVGNLIAFIQYAMMILMSLIMLSFGFIMIPRAQASAKRINEVLNMKPSIVDQESNSTKKIFSSSGVVTFDSVNFRFENAEKLVLEQIEFEAKPGKMTAIIGSTGSGKSTLLHLIPRFFDVEAGSVSIDGVDVRSIKQEDLRKQIGFVPQKATLFTGTVAENMRVGKKDATDEEIKEALKIAQAYDFVMEKEDGLNSVIDKSGANLSGGQKQRLSIARAILRKASIYLFDDSFSALDYKTDARLRKELKTHLKNATFIVVAQRVSSIKDADQIIVINEGKMVGKGTHEELLVDNMIYQEIVRSQSSEEESA